MKKRLSGKIQRGRIPLALPRAEGRGGSRPGAGRPRAINWREVRAHARIGTSEEDIVTVLKIPTELLKDQAVSERLREEVKEGHAYNRVKALKDIGKRASVNVLLGKMRNLHGWDQPQAQIQEQFPEVNEAQLLALLEQLRAGGGPYGAPDQATA